MIGTVTEIGTVLADFVYVRADKDRPCSIGITLFILVPSYGRQVIRKPGLGEDTAVF